MLNQWKESKVRYIGSGDSYIRFTPTFSFKWRVMKWEFSWSKATGFKKRNVGYKKK